MKRSEVNAILANAVEFFEDYKFKLPPWAFWTSSEWALKGSECDEIRKKNLGWDITDFGSENFSEIGLTLFTLRNGDADTAASKNYCEKIMFAGDGQVTPWHYHKSKTEDIINRGGANLVIELQKINTDGTPSNENFTVQCDGISRSLKPLEKLTLEPGESITLEPYMSHTFYGQGGSVLIGEVSKTNDDSSDNFFLGKVGRFPEIEEDETPLYLLCSDEK